VFDQSGSRKMAVFFLKSDGGLGLGHPTDHRHFSQKIGRSELLEKNENLRG